MLELLQIPVWRDNYAYLLVNHEGDAQSRAFVVDAPEAGPVLACLEALDGVRLEAVVNTHHHPDHVGGNEALVAATGCEVVGPAHDRDRIPALTRAIDVDTTIEVAGIALRVLDVRAHTRAHVAFACDRPVDRVVRHGHGAQACAMERLGGRPALFVGDSLFLGGCGRLFEGSAEDLRASMAVLAAQDPRSLVCCAHEYTHANFRFAAHVLAEHVAIRRRLEGIDQERTPSGSSVPDTLARELETNPFLLALDPDHRRALAGVLDVPPDDASTVLGALRSAKDRF